MRWLAYLSYHFWTGATESDVRPVLARVDSEENLADWFTRPDMLNTVRKYFQIGILTELSLSDYGLRELLMCEGKIMRYLTDSNFIDE